MKTSIVTVALILCLVAASAWSQTRTKLNVIYPAISGINAPLWYATEQKVFPKYGIDVELIYIPTALQVTRVVLTGDSQIAFSGGAPVVSAVLSGADLVFVGGVANVPAFYMMALPEIKSVADSKGENRRRHTLRLIDRFRPALSHAETRIQFRQGCNHPPTRRHAGARRGALQTTHRSCAIVRPNPHPRPRRRRPTLTRYGQSRSLFSPHRRHHHPGFIPEKPTAKQR